MSFVESVASDTCMYIVCTSSKINKVVRETFELCINFSMTIFAKSILYCVVDIIE